jgi:hypothetical protein
LRANNTPGIAPKRNNALFEAAASHWQAADSPQGAPDPSAPLSLPVPDALLIAPLLCCFLICLLRALSRLGKKPSVRQRRSLSHVTSASCRGA